MMDLMCPLWMMLSASGLSIRMQCRTSRMPEQGNHQLWSTGREEEERGRGRKKKRERKENNVGKNHFLKEPLHSFTEGCSVVLVHFH